MNLKASHLSNIKRPLILLVVMLSLILNACKKQQYGTPVNVGTIRFTASSYSLERNAAQPLTVTLPLSLPLEQDATAIITIDNSSTAVSTQYTIAPAIPASGLTLNLAKGATEVSFVVTSLENFEGDITIVLKLTSATGGLTVANNNPTTTITIKGKPVILPAVTPSVPNLDFLNVTTGTTLVKQFTVTGVKLTAPVFVTAPSSYKVSLDNVTFSNSVSITAAAAMAAQVTVYAQFAPATGVNQSLQGNITIASGTLSANVAVNGSEVGNAAPGVLILKEDLDYGTAAGALTAKSAGIWTAYSAAGANAVQYVYPGLTYNGYAGSGVGGALVCENKTASSEDVILTFPAQNAGTVYVAQLLNFVSAPATADFFNSLGDATPTTPAYFNRVYAKSSGSQFVLGISKNSTTTPAYTATNLDYGTTYLVVTKYDYTTGISSLYILNGAIPTIEPANAAATSTGGADAAVVTRIVIRQNTSLSLKTTYDGVRIATSWKQAVGL